MEYPIQLVEKVSINVHVITETRMTADKGTLRSKTNITDTFYRQLNDMPFPLHHLLHPLIYAQSHID